MELVKCEICGKLYPKGSICCGVGAKNEPYLSKEKIGSEPQVGR